MKTEKWRTGNAGLLAEADRSMYKNKDTVSKSIIHPEKTHLNYNLCPHKQYTMREIKAINKKIRGKEVPKNAIAWGSTILTMPKDYTGSIDDFFRTGYEGMKEMYGLRDEDIISAYVHLDETTPHIHCYFIPIAHEKEKPDCINWNKVMPRKMYKTQHKILQEYMTEKLHTPVNLLNGETLGIDLQRLSAEDKQLSMGLEQKREELQCESDKVESAKAERKLEEEHKEQLQNEVLDLQGAIYDKQAELQNLKKEEEEIGKAREELQAAMEHILKQLEALKPKQREREQRIFDLLEKKGRKMGKGSLGEIEQATEEIRQESARLDERYFAEPEEPEGWEYD